MSKRWTYKKSPHFTAKNCNFTASNLTKIHRTRFTRKKSEFDEFDIYSKQKYSKLVRDGGVEEEVQHMQEVRGSNPCKGGAKRWLFVSSPLTVAVKLYNFTAFQRKIMNKNCGEKKTKFSPLILHIFRFFLDTGSSYYFSVSAWGAYFLHPLPKWWLIPWWSKSLHSNSNLAWTIVLC